MKLDIEHIASEESQQDWDRLEYKEIYRQAFIDGAKYVEECFLTHRDKEELDLRCKLNTLRSLFSELAYSRVINGRTLLADPEIYDKMVDIFNNLSD